MRYSVEKKRNVHAKEPVMHISVIKEIYNVEYYYS